MEAVFENMGGLVRNLRLVGYRTSYRYEEEECFVVNEKAIEDAPSTLNLSMVKHIFEIEADGVKCKVAVDGNKPTASRL